RTAPSGGFPGGGFSMGGNGGANLNYTDDELDSYSTIWDGEITTTGDKDHRRVVKALKNISEGNDLEKYLDVDNVLKYMAVHTFAVNMDSLSGSMAHNYYLYEYDGRLNIFPWDYNLSFGGMSMGSSGNATEMVNDAIDTPFSGTDFFDALLENEEYLERYHAYLQQLVDEYVNGGRFDEVYERITSRIDSLVETDPTAFYTYEEYQTASDLLYQTIKLRAESIEGQLNGTIPSTDEGQRADSSALIDASYIDVKAMGQFSMGGNNDGDFKKRSEKEWRRNRTESSEESDQSSESEGFDFGNFPGGFDFGNMPEGFDSGNMPEGFDSGNMPEGFDSGNMPGGFNPGNMDGFGGFSSQSMSTGISGSLKTVITFAACFVLMVISLIIVNCVRRRRYK
ncbi:MAG: CotH kinase family protein, partial [Lachnospiraceae bacterium]|nr:CotH kinase family protein [Lachnospiraceae bacterium]